jgi:hypothetical protein
MGKAVSAIVIFILTIRLSRYNSIDCSNSAVHRSIMAGICGNGRDGAYSVALSSLYKDDEDGGDVMYGYFAVMFICI